VRYTVGVLKALVIMVVLGSQMLMARPAKKSAAPQKPAASQKAASNKVNAARAMQYTREVTAFGPRQIGSANHKRLEAYLRSQLKNDSLEEDVFTANTPSGKIECRNFIAKFPGTKNGIIVVSGHYDTNYGLKNYVGANDGGSSTGLLLELANQFRGKKRDGYSVWLVWFDAEEAVKDWTGDDGLYGSRHLAQKWRTEGILTKIKAFMLLDMIGDADLNIDREQNSTSWLQDTVYQAAGNLGYRSYFFGRSLPITDDHVPFVQMGVPSVDIIDMNYGPNDSYHHTPKDTIDKVSAKSLGIVGDTVMATISLLDAR
jgi:Zn-dependent M28 family amino/carboxypeptidase